MSLAYYIVSEVELPDLDLFVDGKALAHADLEQLSALCEELQVPDLMDFLSIGSDELEELGGAGLQEQWHEPSAGLACVRALRERLHASPGDLPGAADVAEDLADIEAVLVRLDAAGVRWHLAVDY